MTWRSCACLSDAGLLHSVDFRPLQRCLISKLGAVEDSLCREEDSKEAQGVSL